MINITKLYCGLGGASDHLRYSVENNFGPVVAYNVTKRCNLNCLHCYSSSNDQSGEDELTGSQAKAFLQSLPEVRCPVVLFSGGEPLLRNDLFDLLGYAAALSLRTVISTNGTLIDPDSARRLARAGVAYVGISLDGSEAVHDKFRASKGSFKAALAGIENCKAANLKVGLRFTITSFNYDQIPFIFDIASSTGIRRICFYHLVRAGRAGAFDVSALTAKRTRSCVETIIELSRLCAEKGLVDEVLTVGNCADGPFLLTKMTAEKHPNRETARKLLLNNGGNKTGDKIACVGWNGDVYADQFWRNYCLGSVREKTFKQIWYGNSDEVLKKIRDKSHFADARCLKCRWFDLCKGNFRFLGADTGNRQWLNEPPCYLTDEEAAAAKKES